MSGLRPLLLLDVDGVISLFGFDPAQPPPGRFVFVDGIAHFLSGSAGAHLRALAGAFELAWCTGWEEKANEYLPWALELPGPLPVVALSPDQAETRAHWKLRAIDRYLSTGDPDVERPLAWVDDAHDERCRAWAASRRGPTLLLSTDPATGITEGHVSELMAWALCLCNASAHAEDLHSG